MRGTASVRWPRVIERTGGLCSPPGGDRVTNPADARATSYVGCLLRRGGLRRAGGPGSVRGLCGWSFPPRWAVWPLPPSLLATPCEGEGENAVRFFFPARFRARGRCLDDSVDLRLGAKLGVGFALLGKVCLRKSGEFSPIPGVSSADVRGIFRRPVRCVSLRRAVSCVRALRVAVRFTGARLMEPASRQIHVALRSHC